MPKKTSITFLSSDAEHHISAITRCLERKECIIHYSSIPGEGTVTVTAMPDWEVRARRKNSSTGQRKVLIFQGVCYPKMTTQDTLTMGTFEHVECINTDGRTRIKFSLKEIIGDLVNTVEFDFSQCKFTPLS